MQPVVTRRARLPFSPAPASSMAAAARPWSNWPERFFSPLRPHCAPRAHSRKIIGFIARRVRLCAGQRHAADALLSPGLDLLIVPGSGLNGRDTMQWSRRLAPSRGMISVNLSPKAIALETAAGLVGGRRLRRIPRHSRAREECRRTSKAGIAGRKTWIATIRSGPRLYDIENLDGDQVPIHPARVVGALRKALPRDAISLVGSGAHRAFAGQYFERLYARAAIFPLPISDRWDRGIPAANGVACARCQAPRSR